MEEGLYGFLNLKYNSKCNLGNPTTNSSHSTITEHAHTICDRTICISSDLVMEHVRSEMSPLLKNSKTSEAKASSRVGPQNERGSPGRDVVTVTDLQGMRFKCRKEVTS